MTSGSREAEPAGRADLIIVGSGVAGLTAAAEAARLGLSVIVVTKGAVDDTNTRWAQGGIAVVLPGDRDADDSVHRHITDTLTAGVGLCDPEPVRTILANGPGAVAALRRAGAVFDPAGLPGRLARTREGGHSGRRVIHAGGDATGVEVERTLQAAAVSARPGSITVLEHHTAVRVLRSDAGVEGLLVLGPGLDTAEAPLGVLHAPAVLLATGGLGQLYRATSNPSVATADGIALALWAGAPVADIEFIQFHPTVLYTGAQTTGRRPLVTEAVRGEGATLVDGAGRSVMEGVHPLGDLAPRDVVSATITRRLADAPGGVDDHVYLDSTHLSADRFRSRFPTVHAACERAGIDPSTEPIPVAPAAHFGCGGVVATSWGRTEVPGLYAAGEVARTGLHGANRLASNSLLEGLVVGTRAARAAAADLRVRRWPASVTRSGDGSAGSYDSHWSVEVVGRSAVQDAMSRDAGIGRDADGLDRLTDRLADATTIRLASRRTVEDAALTVTARAIAVAASARLESRGCHVRTDYPDADERSGFSTMVRLVDGNAEVVGRLAPGEMACRAGAA